MFNGIFLVVTIDDGCMKDTLLVGAGNTSKLTNAPDV
jgi:hypothetical protein